jgi:hypothetical protein
MTVRPLSPPLLLLATAAVLSGCTLSDRDVSRDPHFLVGYRPGEVYELVRPVTLLRITLFLVTLVAPIARDKSAAQPTRA